jgi:integrating conjugative element protein (TIGR03749 family)
MIKPLSMWLLLIHLAANATAQALEVERVIWNKQPIPVVLVVGNERLIHFPGDIRYWIPETLQEAVTVIAANGVLYIQSKQPFLKTRLRVQELATQRIYLLDIVSQKSGHYPENLMVTPKSDVVSLVTSASPLHPAVDWPIRLIRFAAQALYAPERLSPTDPGIRRIAVDPAPVGLLRGGDTESTPLGQWQGGGLFVTAVLVRNLSKHTIDIAPAKDASGTLAIPIDTPINTPVDTPIDNKRTLYLNQDVRGAWLYAASQHSVLHPAGDDADRTCLYLVSRRPFVGIQ